MKTKTKKSDVGKKSQQQSEKVVRAVLAGATGRMGQEILHLAKSDKRFVLEIGVSRRGTPLVTENFRSIHDVPGKDLDVVVDFSQPELLADLAKWCVQNRLPLVSGVTGISPSQKKILEKTARDVPILWAPNMSLGIAVVMEMMKSLSVLRDADFQVEEVHHKRKKDRPSGTAILLQEQLEKVTQKKWPAPLAMRGGGVFGIHKIWALGEEEIVTVEHTALNRQVFARGALAAAAWIVTQPPGFYGMQDILKTS